MTAASAHQDRGSRPQLVDHAPRRPTLRTAPDAPGLAEVAPFGMEAQRQLVLKALVERFGGEVTASALSHHLTRQSTWTPSLFGPRLKDVLQDLHSLAAVSLDSSGPNDMIVRLLPAGAALYA